MDYNNIRIPVILFFNPFLCCFRFFFLKDSQEDTHTSISQASVSTGKASAMPDIFSTMLKDTTAEHRAHLFDLNCKICTGEKILSN